MEQHTVVRYVEPLREGGSLPAIVEASDGNLYVIKFRGAGQGPKALIAELVAGELLRALGLPVPRLVLLHLDEALARAERDPEINDLLRNSVGSNLGLDYLSGAFGFDALLMPSLPPALASAIVWGDAFLTNVDRTPRNPNMLLVDGELWLIDHGAALYVHHNWRGFLERSRSSFVQIKDHILLPAASDLAQADATLPTWLSSELFHSVLQQVPDEWLSFVEDGFVNADAQRAAYVDYLTQRLEAPRAFAREAQNAYAKRV